MTIPYIQENPYRLADEITGIGFKRADLIARAMGISLNSKYRIHSGIRYTLNIFHGEGHTYAPSSILIDRARELLGVEETEIIEGIQEMALKQKIQLERRPKQFNDSKPKNLMIVSQKINDSKPKKFDDSGPKKLMIANWGNLMIMNRNSLIMTNQKIMN